MEVKLWSKGIQRSTTYDTKKKNVGQNVTGTCYIDETFEKFHVYYGGIDTNHFEQPKKV